VFAHLSVNKEGPAAALNAFLRGLLESRRVEAVLAPRRLPSGDAAAPALISDPGQMEADPFAPVMSVSTASVVSSMTREAPLPGPVAVLIRGCQIRALVELVKLKQASLDNVILIGVDCAGTFNLKDYARLGGEPSIALELFEDSPAHKENFRAACATCVEFAPANCDLVVGLWGMNARKEILLEAVTEKGRALLEGMADAPPDAAAQRKDAVAALREKRVAADQAFREETAAIRGLDALTAFFGRCIGCQNCRRVCPVCYCRECFFCSDALDRAPEDILGRSRTKGAFRLPADTILFHAGRFNHMILSCVECGLCEQACPAEIPLMQMIKRVAHDAREQFGYLAGRSLDEEIPFTVFHEDEFHEVGES